MANEAVLLLTLFKISYGEKKKIIQVWDYMTMSK